MIYYGKTCFGCGPKLIAIQVRQHSGHSATDASRHSSLSQVINPAQDRNASAAGQLTVLPDASAKTPNAVQGNQNLFLPPALTAPGSSEVPAFSNFSSNLRDADNFGQNIDLMRLYKEAAFNDPVLNSACFTYATNKEIYW